MQLGTNELIGAVAVVLQLAVALYALHLSRLIGSRKVGWLLAGGFLFLLLLQCFQVLPVAAAGDYWLYAGSREVAFSLMSAALLLLAALHIRRLHGERRQADDALIQERNRLQALIEHLPDHIYIKDLEGRLVLSNPAYTSLLGAASPTDTVGRTMSDFFPAAVAGEMRADDERVIHSGEPVLNKEFTLQDAAGNTRRLLVCKVPMRDAQGRTIGLAGINRDISALRSAIDEIRQSEELYRSLVDVLPQNIFRKDPQGRFTFVNAAYARLLGRQPGDIIGLTDFDLFPRDLAEKYQRDDQRVLQTNRTLETIEKHVTPQGEKLFVQVVKTPLHDSAGKVAGIQAIFWDVTERERAAELAQQQSASMRASIDGMAILDKEGRYIYVNDAHAKVYGFAAPENLIGKTWEVLYEPAELARFHREIMPQFAEQGHWHGEATGRRTDGSTFPQEVSLSRIQGGGIVCVVRDTTDRKQAELDRLALERKLMETKKLESMGVLAGGIAHDFNNLLTAVIGNVSLARMGLPESSPLTGYLDNVEKTALQAADLCKQMLAYSGRGQLATQPVDMNALMRDMENLLRISINKRVVLKLDFADGLPAIEADPSQVRQVLLNLVINASEAIGDRSGVISIRTGIMRADRAYLTETYLAPDLAEGNYVFAEVADNGCGMSPETRARVFDPFFTTKFTGRGLGLAAVLGIVRRHHGAIKVYSEPGRGTTFKFLLPCSAALAEAFSAQTQFLPDWRGSGTALVVDDEETVRSVTAQLMESFGFQVLVAPDGRAGVEAFRAHQDRITAVILDMTMPHMGGEEAFSEMRRLRPDVKVLLVSGYSEEDATSRFSGKGLAGFLQKPFRADDLREKVRKMLSA
jgi:two-component system, cell cycle sensor histidine kinase and response regulator CckA